MIEVVKLEKLKWGRLMDKLNEICRHFKAWTFTIRNEQAKMYSKDFAGCF